MNHDTYFTDIGAWPPKTKGIFFSYLIGFVGSLLMIALAYGAVTHHVLTPAATIYVLLLGAVVQFALQLVFFLHLGSASRDRLAMLGCALLVVTILISGSIWIMFTLNLRMMPTMNQMLEYMNDQDGGI